MLDFDKLNILDSAQEVSDELLAAYIDGNTTEVENLFVEQHVDAEELDTISETMEDYQSFEEHIAIWDGDYGFWELGLPPVLTHDGEINTLNQWKDSPMENDTKQVQSIVNEPLTESEIQLVSFDAITDVDVITNENLLENNYAVMNDLSDNSISNMQIATTMNESISEEQALLDMNCEDLINL